MDAHAVTTGYHSYHDLQNPLQYLHPLEAEGYRKTVRAIRAIGRDCIQKRIRSIKSGEQPPNDILSHIQKVVSK